MQQNAVAVTTDGPAAAPDSLLAGATYSLSDRERRQLLTAASAITLDPLAEPEEFVEQAFEQARGVPPQLARRLRHFARFGSSAGVLLIRNLEVGAMPETPLDNTSHLGARTLLARQMAVLSTSVGEMISYEAEGDGALYQDIIPSPVFADDQISLGSRVELEAHTEQAHSPSRPDHVFLGCLRGHSSAQTYVMTARDLVNALTETEVAIARGNWWTVGVDQSFRLSSDTFKLGSLRGPLSILHGDDVDPFMVIDQDLMTGTSPFAQILLEKAIDVFRVRRTALVLTPGDLLIIDNRRAMHGRSPFPANFDGHDRFLVRAFTLHDLGRVRESRPDGTRRVAALYS